MEDIKVFNHNKFNELRTIYKKQDNQIWFIGKDIAKVLGYRNISDALNRHIDIEDKDEIGLHDSIGRIQKTIIINESGMYSLILRSNLPESKEFKRWVTSEVLPSIRKHSAYMTMDKIEEVLSNPDIIIQLATTLKEEQQKRKQAEQQINQMKPKVLFADSIQSSSDSILIGQLAKILNQNNIDIGQNRLFSWLRENGYLIKRSGSNFNTPTQKSMNLGLMELVERVVNTPYDSIKITKTPKITGKGQVYFINKFLGIVEVEGNEGITK